MAHATKALTDYRKLQAASRKAPADHFVVAETVRDGEFRWILVAHVNVDAFMTQAILDAALVRYDKVNMLQNGGTVLVQRKVNKLEHEAA